MAKRPISNLTSKVDLWTQITFHHGQTEWIREMSFWRSIDTIHTQFFVHIAIYLLVKFSPGRCLFEFPDFGHPGAQKCKISENHKTSPNQHMRPPMVRKCFSYASWDMVRSTLLDCWFLVASYGQTTHFQPDLKSWPLNKNNFSSWTDRVDPRNVFLKEHWHYTHPNFCTYRYLFTNGFFPGKVPFWISQFWPPGGPKCKNSENHKTSPNQHMRPPMVRKCFGYA